MCGCSLRTAACALLLTLCSLCLSFEWVGALYALLFAQCFLSYVPYVCISNEWVLLTYCFLRIGPYAMFLACSLRTAFCVVFFNLCSLCYYFKWMGAPYVLRIAQWFLRYVSYVLISSEWVLFTDSFLRSAPYAMFLVLVFQKSGCSLRTAFRTVLLKLCSLCFYLKWMGAPYVRLCAQWSLRYVISDQWVLLTYCFWRSALYVTFLMFLFQMSGCSWRTAFCAVLLTLCSLCLSFKWVGAPYALLFAQCSLSYVPYACISNEWVLLTYCFCAVLLTLYFVCFYFKCVGALYGQLLAHCFLRYVPCACLSNEWVLFTHCFLRSAF